MTHVRAGRLMTLALTVALAAGCGGPGYEVAEVEGTVTVNGKPLPRARVEFLPDPATGTKCPSSAGETDDAGRYKLAYVKPGADAETPGAVVGKHAVIVLDLKAAAEESRRRFADTYTSAGTTPLTKTVTPGKQTIDLEVTAR